MKRYFALLGIVAIASMMLAAFVHASGCDATGLYSCDSYGGDSDSDGLCNDWEPGYGTDENAADTDGGGSCDGDEVLLDFTSPVDPIDDIS